MTPHARLRGAIDTAYAVFARYERPGRLRASPLRNPTAILRTLTCRPLRELTGEEIGPYAGWALTTVGDVDDYRHFLPRILEEATVSHSWLGTMPEVIAERLARADWRDWPRDEQQAVTDVFLSAWGETSRHHPDQGGAEPWLCGLATLGLDVPDLLAGWLNPLEANAVLQIAQLLSGAPDRLRGMAVEPDGFWDEVDEAVCLMIGDWLASDEVGKALVWAKGEIAPEDAWGLDNGMKALKKFRRTNH